MTTRWRKLQFIGFSQKVLLVCNSPQAAGQQLPVRRDGDRICSAVVEGAAETKASGSKSTAVVVAERVKGKAAARTRPQWQRTKHLGGFIGSFQRVADSAHTILRCSAGGGVLGLR
jgi:hypothetical protein